jgi:ribonuclease G
MKDKLQQILLNVESKETRYAYLRFGRLEDLIIERKSTRQITGNIYRGKVINILQNIQSAFIDINEEDNGFIHISDILENKKKFEEMFDMDFDLEAAPEANIPAKDIVQILKIDQPVLVQVVKEAIGSKGARLTSNLSIPGRYLVLLPNSGHRGVSRKIEDRSSREKLKKFIRSFEMPQDMGLICRTASIHASAEVLIQEAKELLLIWQEIVEKFHKATGPTLLFEEEDIVKKAILTAVDKKYDRIVIDHYETYKKCQEFYKKYEQEHPLEIVFFDDKTPLFEKFSVEKEIDKALKRKVWLPCGGYLYFDKTEAMCTIDVNSGKSSDSSRAQNVEENLVQINLEAAEEISRQLKLRNIGGLVICDFIDMRFRKNQRRVLEKLKECMKEDSAKCTVLSMSEFGLVEMTRQRSRISLAQTLNMHCPYCSGKGSIKSMESIAIEIERYLKKFFVTSETKKLKLTIHPYLHSYIQKEFLNYYQKMAKGVRGYLQIAENDTFHLNQYQFNSLTTDEIIEI